MPIPIRRIVTGHDAQGRSIVVSDGPTPNIYGPADDPILINFWATRTSPADPNDPVDPAARRMPLGPTGGGSTFRFFRVWPEHRTAHLSLDERKAQVAAYYRDVSPGHDAHRPDGRHQGFHQTESVDYIVLLEGEVTLMLDEGDVAMKPFDVVIQRGTNHSWVNYGQEAALMMAVLVDGKA
jgi:hypothetical protein